MINSLAIFRAGNIIANIDIDENTVFNAKLPGTELITCPVTTLTVLKLEEEDYIIWKNAPYKIRVKPQVGKNSENLAKTYNINFLARFYDLLDTYVQDEGAHVFPYFGTAAEHLALLLASANIDDTDWIAGQVDNTEPLLLNYDWTFIRPALDMIAEAFKLEWSANGTTINLVATVGSDTGLTFEQGRSKGLHQIEINSDTSKEKINRVYGIGGTRNIDSKYRNGEETNLVFEERYVETPGVTAGSERVREGKYENLELYPRFQGVVGAVNFISENGKITSATIQDTEIDFNLLNQLQEGVKPKVSFLTGPVTGIDFEISDFNFSTKTVTLIPFTDTTGYYYPSATSKPESGDKFTFIDVRMPASYVATWENKLKAETTAFLNQNKGQRIIYSVKPDAKHLRDNNIQLNIGDRVTLIDSEFEINEIVRFTEISYPLVDEFDVTGIIGNEIVYDKVSKIFATVLNNTKQIAEITARGIIQYKRAAQALRQLESSVFDTDGNFDTDKFNVGVLTAAIGIFGVKSQNFVLSAVRLTDNIGGDANAVNISGGQLIHLEISNIGTNGDTWTITPLSQSGLNPLSLYYIYVKCSKTSQVGSWVVTTDKIKPEDVAGFYHFLAGRIYPVNNGFRDSEFTYGITDITGNRIKTGTITGRNNALEINLETGTIKGDVTFVGNSLSAINNISNNASSALNNAATAQGVANTAISNAGSALTAANNAQNSANLANQVIANIANDNILAASEKPDVLKEYNIIIGERPIIVAQAGQYSVSATNYDNNYSALINYLNPLLSAMGSDDVINGTTFRQYFTNYYNEKVSLLGAIAIKAKQLADNAQSTANTAISNAAIVQNNLTNIQNALGGLAYQSAVELAQLGSTIIQGGYIKTSLIETNALIISGGLATQSFAQSAANNAGTDALSNATTLVNNLQIGAVNNLNNSNFALGLTGWVLNGGVATPVTVDGRSAVFIGSTAYSHGIYTNSIIKSKANTWYTISFDIKGSYYDILDLLVGYSGIYSQITVPNSAVWQRVSYTTNSNNVSGSDAFIVYGTGYSQQFYITNIKVEEGQKATGWTPSVYDVSNNAQALANTAQTNATNLALGYANAAQAAAQNYATSQSAFEREVAKSYADGKISAEELARINQAATNLADAKADSQAKFLTAVTNANGYTDTKTIAAISAAQTYADSVSTTKANAAVLSATSAASSDATAKANAAQSAAVLASQQLLNDLSIGAVNNLNNSNFALGLTNWGINGGNVIAANVDGRSAVFIGSTAYGNGIYTGSIVHVKTNTWYTISFDIKGSYYDNLNLLIGYSEIYNQISVSNSTAWQRVSYTTNSNSFSGYSPFIVYGSGASQQFYITNIKVEEGQKATGWTPSVYDVSTTIQAAQTAANNAITAYNNLTSALKGMAYQDVVEYSKLGSTIIEGGMIRTNLIDADYIKTNFITASYIQGLDIVGKSIRTPGTDKFFEVSAALNNFRLYSGGNVLLEGDDDSAVESITIQANDFPLPPTITITYGPGFRVGDFATSDGASSIGRKGFITNGFYKKINQVSGATEFEVSPEGVVKANTGLNITGNTVLDTVKVKDGNTELSGWTGYVFQVAGGSSNQVRIHQTPSIPPGATWVKTTYKNGIVVNVEGGQN
ncbi:hypothetical protein [Pedobacter sp. Leaf170]|uniref:hypothetical protein n=1 Tax=Pedobacter sp. Leaf170 TaxID=2876558 RepID=UPI001E370C36|nr:hypothetical protein [Pedobacter sp. Leaf170]